MSRGGLVQSRWLLPGLLLLLAVLVGLSTLFSPSAQNGEPLANRSIYNTSASGYRAWWLACQKSGLGLTPWEKSFDKLDTLPGAATMLMVEPFTFSSSNVLFGEKEAELTLDWVRQGNTLVLLDDFHRAGSHAVAQKILARVWGASDNQATPAADRGSGEPSSQALSIPASQKALSVYVTRPVVSRINLRFRSLDQVLSGTDLHWEPILVDQVGKPLLIRVPLGKGALILGTATDLADNQYLHNPANDNYQFLANVLKREGKPVFVNEYVHAYQEAADLMSFLGKNTPLGVIFVQLVLGFILLLWLSFMRWTPKPKTNAGSSALPEVDSLQAYIQSMARMYMRSQAASLVLAPQVERIQALLRRRHRLTLEDETQLRHILGETQLKHLLGTSPGDYSSKDESPEALADALQQARLVVQNEARLSHRELLKLARQLTLIEERLQYERHRVSVRS